MPPECSLRQHTKKKSRNEHVQLKVSIWYYSNFRSGMKFQSKMKILNPSIYTSVWKPNRSGHSQFFGNFCFLEPLTLCLGSRTWTGQSEMCCRSVEREECFVLQDSLTFPLILGVGVVEITQDFSVCCKKCSGFILSFLIALFHKSNLQRAVIWNEDSCLHKENY